METILLSSYLFRNKHLINETYEININLIRIILAACGGGGGGDSGGTDTT